MYSDPKKGATPAMVEMQDKALPSWADLVEVKTGFTCMIKLVLHVESVVPFKPFSMRKQKGA
ncbi:hypothetical protein ABIE66_002809 [Peribacillus sp. B2I2]